MYHNTNILKLFVLTIFFLIFLKTLTFAQTYTCDSGSNNRDQNYVQICECENGCSFDDDDDEWFCNKNCRILSNSSVPADECNQINYIHLDSQLFCSEKVINCSATDNCRPNSALTPTPTPNRTTTPTPTPTMTPVPNCGNGILNIGEECDDGNRYDFDYCTNQCRIGMCSGGNNCCGSNYNCYPTNCYSGNCGMRFNDCPYNYTFYPYINNLYNDNVINGYEDGSFRPDYPVTRGEISKMIVNAFGLQINLTCGNYRDVPYSHPYYIYANTLRCYGIVSDYFEDYHPDRLVSRAETAKYLINAVRVKRGNSSYLITNSTSPFMDINQYHSLYPYVMSAYSNGIVSGDGAYFLPDYMITRGQVSKIIDIARNK